MTSRVDKLAMMEELELAMEDDKAKPQVAQLSDLGLVELTRAGEFIYETNHKELEVLICISLIYFTICFLLSIQCANSTC